MKDRPKGPIVILGAGPTGLGAAYKLQLSGYDDWVLYERDEVAGGLSKSFIDERGFTWDVGGHVVFSHYGLFSCLLDNLLEPSDWLQHERESWIRVVDTWVPYPFQNNIHRLPPELCVRCLEGLLAAALNNPAKSSFVNFDEFISRTFGKGIAEVFMRPYNRKLWACSLTKLDAGWVGDRVSVPDPLMVARNTILKNDDVSWGPNNRFRFPKTGGTGAIWKALANKMNNRIYFNHGAIKIDTQAKNIYFANGHKQHYKTLISTMPLDCLAMISDRPEWKEKILGLLHSSVHIIGLGLKGKPMPGNKLKCWVYFPENHIPAYRVTHFSHYSPNNVDDISQHWSLMGEVAESPDKPVDRTTVVDKLIRGLAMSNLIQDPNQVVHRWHKKVEYAYPTPLIGRDKIVNPLLTELHEMGILSRGRFGAWRYEVGNMDHSFMQGWEAALHVLYGTPEITLWYPNLVNNPDQVFKELGRNNFLNYASQLQATFARSQISKASK